MMMLRGEPLYPILNSGRVDFAGIAGFGLLWVSCFEMKVNGVIRLVVKVSARL